MWRTGAGGYQTRLKVLRKLSWMLWFVALLTPTLASALGLGEIRLHSALNEPLDAEVRLLSATSEQVSAMEAELASYETFNRFGVDRPGVLMQLDFQVEETAEAGYRIHITSDRPIREPFLDFILEVRWRSGRLLREYTVLLDPPELTREAPPEVEEPEMAQPAPAPEPQPEPAPAPAETAAAKPLSYGPVQEDETLWSIAKDMRPDDSVSVPQMMMALLKANPEAFYDNNVNRLKAGSILRLEDPGLVQEMGRTEASQELRRQTRAWRDYKARAAEQAERRPPTEAAEEAPAEAAAAEGDRLELVTPEGETKAAAGAPAAAEEPAGEQAELEELRQELMRAQEAAEAQRSENEQLQERVQELEGQLASIQRLLTLQNEELANLQRRLGEEPAPIKPEEEAPEAAEPEPQPEPKPEAEAKPAPAPQPAPAPSGPSMGGFVGNLLGNPIVAGALAIVGISLLALVALIIRRRRSDYQESILTGETSSMTRARQRESGAASEESSLPSDLAFSGMESIQADESEVDPVTEAEVYLAYGRNQQAEELLKRALEQDPNRQELRAKLLEFYYKTGDKQTFVSEAENAQASLEENGPLWDRVLAMGHELAPEHPLFAQAPSGGEAVSTEAEPPQPEQDVMDIGLDLDALAAEMEPSEEEAAAAGSDLGEFDLSIPDLEGEFGGEEGEPRPQAGEAPEETALEGEAPPVAGFELPAEDEAPAPAAESEVPAAAEETAEEEGKGGDLDFDLGDFELPSEAETEEAPAAQVETGAGDDDNALEFDLSGLDLGEEPVAEPDPGAETEPTAEAGALSLEPDAAAEPQGAETPEPEEEEKGGLDFDLGDFELPEEGEAGAAEAEAASAATEGASEEQDLGLGELEWDLGETGTEETEAGAESGAESGAEEDIFAGLDDVGTKLDLARAYADMGDSEAARNMLEEVLQEGDDGQRQQANEILQNLE